MDGTTISVVVVSFNVRDLLYQSLRSIQRALKDLSAEIIVVDNASWDGSVAMIRDDFPEIKLIENEVNRGFAQASNRGMAASSGAFVVLLNPDTIVQEDTFRVLLDFFASQPEAGMVGCKILNPDGSLQLACRRSIPTPWVAFTKLVGLARLFPQSRLFGRYNLTYLDPEQTNEVEAISGSFMMTRAEVIQDVGTLDEAFFMYGEDLDWCLRIRQAGHKLYYVPTTQIVHYKGASTQKASHDVILLFYRAMLLFVRKHFKGQYLFLPQWFLILGIGLRGLASFLHRQILSLRWMLVDVMVLNLSLFLAIFIRFGSTLPLKPYLTVTLIYSTVWIATFYFFDLYGHRKLQLFRGAGAVLTGLLFNSTITYFAKSFAFSRAVVILAGVLNLLLIPGWRLGLMALARRGKWGMLRDFERRHLRRRSLIVGEGRSVAVLLEKLARRQSADMEVVAALLTDADTTSLNGAASTPVYFDADKLPIYVHQTEANEVILSSEGLHYGQILSMITQSQDLGVDFRIASDNSEVIIGGRSVDYLGDVSLVDIEYRLGVPSVRFLKRVLDLALALPVLLFSLPAWPVLWLQGCRLRRFPIHSGRRTQGLDESIPADSDAGLWAFSKGGEVPSTHLQKMPVLLSVVTGKLSLVGRQISWPPQEHPEVDVPLTIQPGIFSYGGSEDLVKHGLESREKMAIYYLKNYSLLLDLRIIMRSITKRN